MPACYCTYFSCNGQFVDDKTRKHRARFDKSQEYHKNAEVLSVGLYLYPWLISFQDNTSNSTNHPELASQGESPRPTTLIEVSGATHKAISRKDTSHCCLLKAW